MALRKAKLQTPGVRTGDLVDYHAAMHRNDDWAKGKLARPLVSAQAAGARSPIETPDMLECHPPWTAKAVLVNILIFAGAAAFTALAFAMFLAALPLVMGALFIGSHAFAALGMIACMAVLCLACAAGLLLRHMVGWWIGTVGALAVSLVAGTFAAQGPDHLRVIAIGFAVIFAGLVCSRKYFAESARRVWDEDQAAIR